MASELSSNIRQLARELKETDRKTASRVRRAIRLAIAEAATSTSAAIQDAARAEDLTRAAAATSVRVSFAVRSGGAKISTDQKKAPYARPLEKGSQGSGGKYDRHPVFGSGTVGPLRQGQRRALVWVNQPTRPFFYPTVSAMEPFSEEVFSAAVDTALAEAGWKGAVRRKARKAAIRRQATTKQGIARRRTQRARTVRVGIHGARALRRL